MAGLDVASSRPIRRLSPAASEPPAEPGTEESDRSETDHGGCELDRRTEIRPIAWALFAAALLAAGAAGAECPAGNAVDQLSSNVDGFSSGIDFSELTSDERLNTYDTTCP